MSIKNVSVIGLGLMGTPITTLLIRAGYAVTGYDLLEKQISTLVPLGMKSARTAREASEGADLILLSLPNWAAVTQALEGPSGVLEAARPGQIIIDTSTVPPWETAAMAERLGARGLEWMDVPISGSSAQAKVGNMVFMAGGRKSTFEKAKPVLDAIGGKKTVYVGKNGDAAMLKLVVNHILFINQAAAIEGLVLGTKAGLDPGVMLDVITSGAASSDLLMARGKDMLSGCFDPKGPVDMAIKDLGLALEAGKQLGVMLPMGGLYLQFLLKAHYNGWDRNDATVVMKIYEQLAGITPVEAR